jgi:hypothetical protein
MWLQTIANLHLTMQCLYYKQQRQLLARDDWNMPSDPELQWSREDDNRQQPVQFSGQGMSERRLYAYSSSAAQEQGPPRAWSRQPTALISLCTQQPVSEIYVKPLLAGVLLLVSCESDPHQWRRVSKAAGSWPHIGMAMHGFIERWLIILTEVPRSPQHASASQALQGLYPERYQGLRMRPQA